ncbi:argininosuccinate lyase [Candidatus Vidania fulgoroideorum]
MKKVWSNRFKTNMSEKLFNYTSSRKFDGFLLPYDIKCVLVHCKFLSKINVLKLKEYIKLKTFLKKFKKVKNKEEDIHLYLENEIIKKLGIKIGNKIRTARSRNDLVSTDLKLWFKKSSKLIFLKLKKLMKVILYIANKNYKKIFPSFTHFQIAQPTTFGHYILSYFEMLKRDLKRIYFFSKINNYCPLGSCAVVGTSFNINRNKIAKFLGFYKACNNSIDGVSDRDYVIDYLYFSSMIMLHLSRLSEDIVNYSNNCIGIIDLSDKICTGSSLMPQKKNPDILEVARGRTNLVFGKLFSFFNIINSQTLSYNKDNQEDKLLVLETEKIIKSTISVFKEVLLNINVNEKRSIHILNKNFSTSTDIAEYLAKKGLGYKKSHSIVSKIVRKLIDKKKNFSNLDNNFLKKIDKNYFIFFKKNKINFKKFSIKYSIYSKKNKGNTSPFQVKKQIEKAYKYINNIII